MKLKAPITVLHNGTYLPPGTDIELSDEEAAALIARHGEFDGDATLGDKDLESLRVLNKFHAISDGGSGNG